jgi:ABC-2 type transport system ATP-binding protein
LVEILEGYRQRDGGRAEVLGTDPASVDRRWRERIGIVLQDSDVHPELTAREAVEMFAGYYPNPLPVSDTLARVGLIEQAGRRAGKLSGGQKRRLDLAMGIVGRPEVLFLDEPTTGFDPAARRESWELVRGLRDLGTTVFLTTHYMQEAEALAERIAIIVSGRIAAQGTIAELAAQVASKATITWRSPGVPAAPPGLTGPVGREGPAMRLETTDAVADLDLLLRWSRESGNPLEELEVKRATLEDIYLELTSEASR